MPVIPIPALFAAEPTPPTCETAGSFDFEDTFPNVSVTVSPAYDGPGVYQLTITAENGATFSDGTTTKTRIITVEGALGFQSTDPAAPCFTGSTPTPTPTQFTPAPTPTPTPTPTVLNVGVLAPICDNDVPKLRYEITATGTTNTTVTITWINPGGADVVLTNQPLSGTVNWPGAVSVNGRGVDWPGWRQLSNGTWVQGDEFDWVRPSVNVLFQVNPEATVTVAYPPSSPSCLTSPVNAVLAADGQLSATGNDPRPLLAVSTALAAVGFAMAAGGAWLRRREQSAD
ncbi:hypothetical protein [Cellulomonas sp. URHE0023]|uniref:hypothetical protein n=1 Tax=Cellulomonas sp. URHE0023 TaxID=1380354 RepID=UPI00068FF4ED|nr:hypothetical protein [Cellulomonas sp. URHE0023]